MLAIEGHQNLGIRRADHFVVAIRQIDAAVGHADIEDRVQFIGRDLFADCLLDCLKREKFLRFAIPLVRA